MEDAEKRISKLRSTKKDGKKLKKAMRDKNKEISSMRQELLLLWNGADPDLKNQIEQFMLINILGQTVLGLDNLEPQEFENGYQMPSHLTSGTYIAYFKIGTSVKTKKIIIK